MSGVVRYPEAPPFHPSQAFPEYPFGPHDVRGANDVYAGVRECFRLLGLDAANFGTPQWNPLGDLIVPGQKVLIKPNFVLHWNAGGGPLDAVITHGSVIRAVADYVFIALKGKGELVIADAPQMNCDLAKLFQANGMDGVSAFLSSAYSGRGVKVGVYDLREERTIYRYGIIWRRISLDRSPDRTVPVVLGRESYLEGIDASRLYGADYDRRVVVAAHQHHQHEYRVSSEVLSSDVVISIPKLKVHSKVGTTLNIKNLVGINRDKNHLAHYRIGPPAEGGDEIAKAQWDDTVDRWLSDRLLGHFWKSGRYPFVAWRVVRYLLNRMAPARSSVQHYGNWHGNDTAWRMALDLHRILLTADATGKIQAKPVRTFFSVIDGVIAGEGNGPLHPDPYPAGVLISGFNPVTVDWHATRLMGFDPEHVPMYRNAAIQMLDWVEDYDVNSANIVSNQPAIPDAVRQCQGTAAPVFTFRAPPGWVGTMELYAGAKEAALFPEPEFNRILQ
ncbi:MAG TPA: DUF362 domain-containing protein [Candidatus Angelobacter sp.]|nr:DUF362 domain-containing protein [Candidatus Angelobacter sp.]